MTTDYRSLCVELIDALDSGIPAARIRLSPLANRARAALAEQPVREGPSDEELLSMRSWSSHGSTFDSDLVDFARSVLARWGNPAPQPPAEGEVARCLADSLFAFKLTQDPDGYPADHWSRRAADLLQRLSPPQPVPVSERPWERQGWCDKDGRCWFGWADEPDASWSLCKPSERDTATVSLPFHALPLPELEVSE